MELDPRRNIIPSRNRRKNVIDNNGVKYRIQRASVSGGWHSCLFEAVREDQGEICMMKICKYQNADATKTQKVERFRREVQALRRAYNEGMDHIIRFDCAGTIVISARTYEYYIMEKATGGDLKCFIYEVELDTAEKLRLCVEILRGIKQLHQLGIYHRDIKPENILWVNRNWKIADLGLIALRGQDYDEPGERIGPFGWLSPEATNKWLTDGRKVGFRFDCVIDDRSDIFQLGKLFWFIFHGNLPIGQLRNSDFQIDDKEIYDVLELMLQHGKQNRLSLEQLEENIEPIAKRYNVQ